MFTSWDSDPYPGCRIEYCSEAIGSAAKARVNDANRNLTQALEKNAELSRQVYKLQDELKEARSQLPAGELPSTTPAPLDASRLCNELKAKYPKAKITLKGVEEILEGFF